MKRKPDLYTRKLRQCALPAFDKMQAEIMARATAAFEAAETLHCSLP